MTNPLVGIAATAVAVFVVVTLVFGFVAPLLTSVAERIEAVTP